MQTIQRIGYFSASCANLDSSLHLYDANMAYLTEVKRNLEKLFKEELGNCNEILATRVNYTPEQYLCVCFYKTRLFFGVQNKKSSQIKLDDESGHFAYTNPNLFFALENRAEFSIKNKKAKNKIAPEVVTVEAWKNILPLMDKIIAFEEKIKHLPEDAIHKLKEKLLYDECIDIIIATGTAYSPELDEKIDIRISQALKIIGKQKPEEHSKEQDLSSTFNLI